MKTPSTKPVLQDYFESIQSLQKNKINVIPTHKARTEKELQNLFKKVRFPWVLKAVGKDILHKTEHNALRLNISTKEQALQAYQELSKIKGCQGIAVQPFVQGGIELIVGGKRDPQFGPVVLIGMGGVYAEILKDTSIRLAPLELKDAQEMVNELKALPILQGARTQKPINFKALYTLLIHTGHYIEKECVQELDLNPVMATQKDVVAVDVRVIK